MTSKITISIFIMVSSAATYAIERPDPELMQAQNQAYAQIENNPVQILRIEQSNYFELMDYEKSSCEKINSHMPESQRLEACTAFNKTLDALNFSFQVNPLFAPYFIAMNTAIIDLQLMNIMFHFPMQHSRMHRIRERAVFYVDHYLKSSLNFAQQLGNLPQTEKALRQAIEIHQFLLEKLDNEAIALSQREYLHEQLQWSQQNDSALYQYSQEHVEVQNQLAQEDYLKYFRNLRQYKLNNPIEDAIQQFADSNIWRVPPYFREFHAKQSGVKALQQPPWSSLLTFWNSPEGKPNRGFLSELDGVEDDGFTQILANSYDHTQLRYAELAACQHLLCKDGNLHFLAGELAVPGQETLNEMVEEHNRQHLEQLKRRHQN